LNDEQKKLNEAEAILQAASLLFEDILHTLPPSKVEQWIKAWHHSYAQYCYGRMVVDVTGLPATLHHAEMAVQVHLLEALTPIKNHKCVFEAKEASSRYRTVAVCKCGATYGQSRVVGLSDGGDWSWMTPGHPAVRQAYRNLWERDRWKDCELAITEVPVRSNFDVPVDNMFDTLPMPYFRMNCYG
jgi:hypothetical protein